MKSRHRPSQTLINSRCRSSGFGYLGQQWPEIFNNDSTLTSALLDRLLHHAESIVIEGRSYRMRDQIDA